MNSLRFLFDGQRINDDQTPKDVSELLIGCQISTSVLMMFEKATFILTPVNGKTVVIWIVSFSCSLWALS